MNIPHIKSIEQGLRTVSPRTHRIGCVNWPGEYPYAPEVSFGIAHTGTEILLRFRVVENHTLGTVTEDNGRVWEDSCVEFFIALDDAGYYYNFEFNCIGAKLLSHRKLVQDFVRAEPGVMQSIKTFPSLGREPVGLLAGPNTWTLDAVIPAEAFFKDEVKDLSGVSARVNLYKCGDNLPDAHFLSFAPIDWPTPCFHLERFFTPVQFGR